MKISGVITNDRSDVHAKSQGQRTKVKVTEVKTQFSCFQTVTPVWIHIWLQNDAQSSIAFQGHMGQKIADFDPNRAFLDWNSSLNLPMAMK